MIKELQLRLSPEEAVNEYTLKHAISLETGDNISDICAVHILKRSIDARQRVIIFNLTLRVFINESPDTPEYKTISYRDVSKGKPVIIVGAGPGGLFAALRLIELGMRPIIVERGKDVHSRKKDIALISRTHIVNPDSNYCFGEGGAGAFSDGKLFTRSKKRGSIDRILHILCQHGADPSILSDAHPHIGTDKLPRVIENIRNQIIACGGEVHFETCMQRLIIKENEVIGVETRQGEAFFGPVILATGHSARDVYQWLYINQIALEAKGIAVGVRLEHPQELIDQIRYHLTESRGKYLPAAEYRFVTRVQERGVYSFCMCPGGFVVPAATGPNQLVVNGMSPSHRNSPWANAGIVVEIHPHDLPQLSIPHSYPPLEGAEVLNSPFEGGKGDVPMLNAPSLSPLGGGAGGGVNAPSPLSLMHFQAQLEEMCWQQGGKTQVAPAQRMTDFMKQRNSSTLPSSSYIPGLLAIPFHLWMPGFITERLMAGFRSFDGVSRGFLTGEAVMIGIETRTSAPVRILRDGETLQHITHRGLFPCGEGAGYAGGIVSAAIDGELCANSVAAIRK